MKPDLPLVKEDTQRNVPESTFNGYHFREGNARDAWRRFSSGEAVIVSEPMPPASASMPAAE